MSTEMNNDRLEDKKRHSPKPLTYELPMCPYCYQPVDFSIDGGVVWSAFCTNEKCGRFNLDFNEEYLGID